MSVAHTADEQGDGVEATAALSTALRKGHEAREAALFQEDLLSTHVKREAERTLLDP